MLIPFYQFCKWNAHPWKVLSRLRLSIGDRWKQCPALNDFVEQTGTMEWVRQIKLIIAHNSLTLFVVTGSFVICNRKSHSSSVGRTRTTCGCCLSCIGVYVSVEHHWILLFDLNMLRTCTYGTLEYQILCQCTHLLYVLLCINPLSYVRSVILTKTNIYQYTSFIESEST